MKKILFFLLGLLFCSQVFAGSINEIVFFGDSLSDDGNLQQVLKIIPKSPPYYQGRFSNGPTWAEYVGKYYYDKHYLKYSNYAYGGATAILHDLRTDPFIAPIILAGELESYFLHEPLSDKSTILYGIWIGANDYLYERTNNLDDLTDDVVNKIIWSVTTLMEKGAQHFLILNLPDLSTPPYAKDNDMVERLSKITLMHNKKLADAVKNLETNHPDLHIVYMDIYSVFNDVLKNTDRYNQKYGTHVTDTIHACWLGSMVGLENHLSQELRNILSDKATLLDKHVNIEIISKTIVNSPSLAEAYSIGRSKHVPCINADDHLFWDGLHPTAVIHRVLGQIVIEALEHENLV